MNTVDLSQKRTKLENYFTQLRLSGARVVQGENGSLWVRHEGLSAVRFPEFKIETPSPGELKKVFKELKCLVVNYTSVSEVENLNKFFLYNCRDQEYNIDKLSSSSVRRNIRYAQRHLKFGFCEWDEVIKNGLKAFEDTRTRVGLSDGNQSTFNERFKSFSQNPAHKPVAAWLDNQLIAFLSIIEVEDFVIIQGTFSTDEQRSLKPNNVLIDFVLDYYLTQRKFSNVCYGLSSVQENTNKDGLHSYKIQVGFEAVPVQRIFILHPSLRVIKPALKTILKFLLFFLPGNRKLRKANGLLNSSN